MTPSKKIFIASTAILAFLLIFWGIYSFSFKKTTPPSNAPTEEKTEPVAVPKTSASQITAISDEAVLAPVLTPEKNAVKYYSKNDGRAYQINLDGTNKKILSDKELPGLVSIAWSPDTSKVITRFENNGKNKFYYYDYGKNQGVQLKENLDTVFWQNDNKIIYKYFDPKTKERTLNISDPDGSNWNKITDIAFRNLSLAPIPKTGLLSFWNSPDAFFETSFLSTPIIGGEKKTILAGKFGADYLWSPDGNLILISSSQEKASPRMQLAIANDRGGEYKNLDIPTFISKAAWSRDNKTVYYALPGNVPANAILPNDYNDKKFLSTDTFWKVNVANGEKSRIIPLDKISGQYDATDLFLNSDESLLFFINRADGKLYKIDL
ncbi:MAG: hypothetical protein WC608_03620 [Parcubacteria group bacterium]